MKRMFLIVATVLCFISAAFAEPWRVFDNAGLFSAEDIVAIEQAIFAFQRSTSFDFAVLTTDDYIGKENWAAVADSFYDSEDFGFGQQTSGMLSKKGTQAYMAPEIYREESYGSNVDI